MPTYQNGKIPASLLRRVSNFRPIASGVTADAGSDLLREDAWAALNMLQLAFYKKFDRALNVSECYRGLTRQTATWQLYLAGGPYAAPVGTSPHGWALAVDFGSGVATYGSEAKVWMDANAPRFGWHPTGNGFPKREAWHFEFRPGTATEVIPASGDITPITEEDEMNQQEKDMLASAFRDAADAKNKAQTILDVLLSGGPSTYNGLSHDTMLAGAFRDSAAAAQSAADAAANVEAIKDAVFEGGDSMPDSGRSLGRSLKVLGDAVEQIKSATVRTIIRDPSAPVTPAAKDLLMSKSDDDIQANTGIRKLLDYWKIK